MKHSRALLLSDRAANRTLSALVGVLVFLFTLCFLAAAGLFWGSKNAAHSAAGNWVILAGYDAPKNTAVHDIVVHTPGVISVSIVSDAEKRSLLQRWLKLPDDGNTPLPFVLDIRFNPSKLPDLIAFNTLLQQIDSSVSLDTGQEWLHSVGTVLDQTQTVLQTAVFLLLLVLLGLVYLVTKITLQHNISVLELLHLMGATDRYIVKRFQVIAWKLVAPPCLLGLLAAIFLAWGLSKAWKDTESYLFLAPSDQQVLLLPLLVFIPMVVLLMALFTCRRTVLKYLLAQA
jgi:cell division transport system permease protein